ncbi:MAG TPA: TylF/MycF/NovP-related O-methyltransferase [Pirellulaceae bacterium]
MKRHLRSLIRAMGWDVVRYRADSNGTIPADASAEDQDILRRIAPYTMTSVDRQLALIHAVRYVVRQGIPGSFVECGVWRGGSSMAAALTLIQEGDSDRPLFLYDTFEGMTSPEDVDRSVDGVSAKVQLDRDHGRTGVWCLAGLDEVRGNLESTGYPSHQVHLIQGAVESTLPSQLPTTPVAVLRLDTDWYASTKHELAHLFPLLAERGVLIIDDYGYWQGARRAVDEYLAGLPNSYYLHRIDATGRLLVKS